MMNPAPIALFVYNRPWHTQQTVASLRDNALAQDSDLFIFSDAPKTAGAAASVQEVREYIQSISGFRTVSIIEREHNLGLAASIIDGVSRLCSERGRVIVLEDDMMISPYFLKYMNEALETYEQNEEVISIHGYSYPVDAQLPETFFLEGADCWGWATWERGWSHFNPDGRALLQALRQRGLLNAFDFNGAYPYSKMLAQQIRGKNDSWAIRWYASAFLAGKLTLYPGKSLVHNIGNDGSGTHCASTDRHDIAVNMAPVRIGGIEIRQLDAGKKAFEDYFRRGKAGIPRRVFDRMQRLVRQVLP